MSKKKKYVLTALLIGTITLFLTGCGLKIGYSSFSSTRKMNASFFFLSDSKSKSIKLNNGETITFDYEITEKKGTLVATFEDSSGNVIYTFEPNSNGTQEIKIEKDDIYVVKIVGEKARGSYSFEWVVN